MNAEWAGLCKEVQLYIKKEETFPQSIDTLLRLRQELMGQIQEFRESLSREDFNAMPFMNANGYHSKTIAYSLYHIIRMDDITANTLIGGKEQVFFSGNYQEKMKSPIITTGNELVKEEIATFSSELDLDGLYDYIHDVDKETTKLLKALSYQESRVKMTEQDRSALESLHVVSTDEQAVWLIDYWCKKDVRGLIQMPLSRHWIMHVEASIRIMNRMKGGKR